VVATAGSPEQVTIASTYGYVMTDPDGALALAADSGSPSSVFVLLDRGATPTS